MIHKKYDKQTCKTIKEVGVRAGDVLTSIGHDSDIGWLVTRVTDKIYGYSLKEDMPKKESLWYSYLPENKPKDSVWINYWVHRQPKRIIVLVR